MLTVSEQLIRARAAIERGFCKYELTDGVGVCTMGALNVAAHGSPSYLNGNGDDVQNAADLLTRVTCGSASSQKRPFDKLVDWNNADGRTKQDVLDAFDAAIAIAQQQEAVPVDPVPVAPGA